MMDLTRGQRVSLASILNGLTFDIGLRVAGIDGDGLRTAVLLLDVDKRLTAADRLILQSQSSSPCGTIRLRRSDRGAWGWSVDLSRAPEWLKRIRLALIIDSADSAEPIRADAIQEGLLGIGADAVEAAYRFRGSDFGKQTGLELLDIYLHQGEWRIAAIGDGYADGLAAIIKGCGGPQALTETAKPEPSPSPSPSPTPAPSRSSQSPPVAAVTASPPPPSPPKASKPAPVRVSESKAVVVAGDGSYLPIHSPACWPGRGAGPVASEELRRSVGLVIADLANGLSLHGTGFVITPGGHLLCGWFMIQDAVQVSIQLEGSCERRPVRLLAGDSESGLALCWISDRMGAPDWLALDDSAELRRPGENLAIFGHPLSARPGASVRCSLGSIRDVSGSDSAPRFSFDAEVGGWMEGGPVLRQSDGKTIGLIARGRTGSLTVAADLRAIPRLAWLSRSPDGSPPPRPLIIP